MALRIPESHEKWLTRIAMLSQSEVAALRDAIQASTPGITPQALAEHILPKVSLTFVDAAGIIAVLVALTNTSRQNKKPIQDISADVATAAANRGLVDKALATEFQQKLATLLSAGTVLSVTSRAASVYFAHASLYHSSRVLTDLRPIFDADDVGQPVAGMVVHNLEITARDDAGERRPHFFALNGHDLRQLRAVVERALQKEEGLKAFTERSGLLYLQDLPNETQR